MTDERAREALRRLGELPIPVPDAEGEPARRARVVARLHELQRAPRLRPRSSLRRRWPLIAAAAALAAGLAMAGRAGWLGGAPAEPHGVAPTAPAAPPEPVAAAGVAPGAVPTPAPSPEAPAPSSTPPVPAAPSAHAPRRAAASAVAERAAGTASAAATTPSVSDLAEQNARFAAAVAARRRGDDAAALRLLDAFLGRYPTSPLAQEARVERLRALRRLGRGADAATAARRYLAEHPDGFARDEAKDAALGPR